MTVTNEDITAEFSDQPAPRPPADGELSRVATLGHELLTLDQRIERGEQLLKDLKEQRRLIAEATLPEAMDAVGQRGLRDFTLNDGSRVRVNLKFRCGQLDDLPDDPKKETQRPLPERIAALTWLDENGHGDLARRTVIIILGKDSAADEARIKAYVESLRLNSLRYSAANVVPWNALSAFAKEQALPPEDLDRLGVQKIRVAEVKRPQGGANEL